MDLLAGINTEFHRQDRPVELGHSQAIVSLDSRLPVVRETLLCQHRYQVVHETAKDGQHGRRVGASEHVVKQALCVLLVLGPSFDPPLAQCLAQIFLCKKPLSIRTPASSACEQLVHEREVWLALVGHECGVAARQAGIVLNGVMLAKLFEIEFIAPVRAVKEVRRKGRNEEAEGRRKVEGLVDSSLELAEGDVTARVRQNAMVCLRERQ